MTAFGKRLRELRNDKGLSQKELADMFFISQPTVADWERGVMETDFSTLTKLAVFFEVSTDYLLGLEDL